MPKTQLFQVKMTGNFLLGMAMGSALSSSSSSKSYSVPNDAFFILDNESDALSKINEAYREIYTNTPEARGFNEDGELIKRTYEINETGHRIRNKKDQEEYKEEDDDTIHLSKYKSNVLLAIELYDGDGYYYADNIMIAHSIQKGLESKLSK